MLLPLLFVLLFLLILLLLLHLQLLLFFHLLYLNLLLMLMLLLSAGITAYSRISLPDFAASTPAVGETRPAASPDFDQAVNFSCDGRQHCSQMRSREEALFFIQHCPDTKMDGDSDGEPCESQFAN